MPNVIAIPRSLQNGDVVTQFTDTTGTTPVTYTYPIQQTSLIIENSGEKDIFVTVGSYTNQVINADKKWRADVAFTSFSIRSNTNSQEFIATAIYKTDDTTKISQHGSKLNHMRGDIEVHVGAGYEFARIQDAIASIQDATPDKRYDIKVHAGTYNEWFTTKDYVNIIGDNPKTCIVDYTAPDPANYVNESTIYATSDSLIENLTIKAKNAKYPIHSDVAAGAYRLVVKNCELIHLGSTDGTTIQAGTPFGIGVYQDQHIEIYDSVLQGYNIANDVGAAGVFCHNQTDTSGIGHRSLRVNNCDIRNVAYGVRLDALAGSSGQKNDVYLTGNRIQSYTSDVYYVSALADATWNVKAFGNNLRKVTNSGGNTYIVEEPGFTKRIRSMSNSIVKGAVVVLFAGGYYGLGTVTSVADYHLVVGVALTDIPSSTEGVIQVKGWVNSLKVDGTTAIVDQDLLSTHTVAGVAKKGTTNAFAIAKGAYSTADSNGLIQAILTKTVYN